MIDTYAVSIVYKQGKTLELKQFLVTSDSSDNAIELCESRGSSIAGVPILKSSIKTSKKQFYSNSVR